LSAARPPPAAEARRQAGMGPYPGLLGREGRAARDRSRGRGVPVRLNEQRQSVRCGCRVGPAKGMAMVGSGESEPLHASLAGVERGATALWVDGTAKDLATLREFTALQSLRIYRLPRRHVPVLAGCPLPRMTRLGVRHADADDLGFLSGFAALETLSVWQS